MMVQQVGWWDAEGTHDGAAGRSVGCRGHSMVQQVGGMQRALMMVQQVSWWDAEGTHDGAASRWDDEGTHDGAAGRLMGCRGHS